MATLKWQCPSCFSRWRAGGSSKVGDKVEVVCPRCHLESVAEVFLGKDGTENGFPVAGQQFTDY